MTNGFLIEGVSREDIMVEFRFLRKEIAELKELIKLENSRDVTLTELAKRTGFCKAQLRRIVEQKNIPFSYEGKELMIKREYLGKFRVKLNHTPDQ